MSTLHERALREAVQAQVDVLGAPLQQVLGHHEARRYPQWLCDFVTQKRNRWDLYDAYAFLTIYVRWRRGELVFAMVEAGAVPEADAEREVNRKTLGKLPHPFSASVEPDCNGDGVLIWSGPLALGERTESVPLEIGSTRSSRTLLHLEQSARGLARWPYGSTQVVLGLCTSQWKHWYTFWESEGTS